jgi:hypothetical protein
MGEQSLRRNGPTKTYLELYYDGVSESYTISVNFIACFPIDKADSSQAFIKYIK